jgi:hypothetical protein
LYASANKLIANNPFAGNKLVGLKGKSLEDFLNEKVGGVRESCAAYSGGRTNEVAVILAYQLKLAQKRQSDKFFDSYLNQAKSLIGFEESFPLVRDLGRRMTADQFMASEKILKSISDDLASPVFQNAPRDLPTWRSFADSVSEQQNVAKALVSEDGSFGSCTVSLAGMNDTTKEDDEWRDTWRDIKLVAEGGTGGGFARARSDTDKKIGDAQISQKIQLVLKMNQNDPGSPTYPISTDEWGALELIHKYKGDRDKADPKTWLVKLPVGAPGAKGMIRLKLKFESVLPERDKWPGQAGG